MIDERAHAPREVAPARVDRIDGPVERELPFEQRHEAPVPDRYIVEELPQADA